SQRCAGEACVSTSTITKDTSVATDENGQRSTRYSFTLPRDVLAPADAGAAAPQMTVLAGLVALLFRYTGEDDLTISIRTDSSVGEMRFDLSDNPSFGTLRTRVLGIAEGSLAPRAEHGTIRFAFPAGPVVLAAVGGPPPEVTLDAMHAADGV